LNFPDCKCLDPKGVLAVAVVFWCMT